MRILILTLLLPFLSLHSQELHHQMLSSQGTSKELSNGVFVSQTIGQQSVIGNYTRGGKTYGQGFQQSVWRKHIESTTNNPITTITFPNPFIGNINFQFSKPIKETIHMELFDIRGRLVFQTDQRPINNLLNVDLPNLASSNYLVKLSSAKYTYYTQILKQE